MMKEAGLEEKQFASKAAIFGSLSRGLVVRWFSTIPDARDAGIEAPNPLACVSRGRPQCMMAVGASLGGCHEQNGAAAMVEVAGWLRPHESILIPT